MSDDAPLPEPATDVGGARQPPSRRPPPKVAIGLGGEGGGPGGPGSHIDALMANAPAIGAAAIVSRSGRMLASSFSPAYEELRIAALSAAMLLLGERIAGSLQRGKLDQVFVNCQDGNLMLMPYGRKAVLVALASSRAKLGLIFTQLRAGDSDLNGLLDDDPL
jgi:predicted regulator of Ras-like GTPase activity (Roadblock/LC7/MglB family)